MQITSEMVDKAAALAGIEIPEAHKGSMFEELSRQVGEFRQIHALELQNELPMALLFDPVLPGTGLPHDRRPMQMSDAITTRAPKDIEELAFTSVRQLAELLRTHRISSTALTQMYLDRLRRYDPLLHCVITLTEERALAQAGEADREIAAGKYRGPLHGMPWGAKDLLSVRGYPTTWGASGFEEQHFDADATVVRRLDAAGAVLIAKLSLGTLAMGGDEWFRETTRNPWKPEQGAAGSSAGSASAVAAGCVAFSIGSETLDSIVAPSARCGATGLRPTFGRVSRTGAMALCWSLDKIGPICRGAEDCALVLDAINGSDPLDRASRDVPFNWDASLDVRSLRVGYLENHFRKAAAAVPDETATERGRRAESYEINLAALEVIRGLGVAMAPVELPDVPWRAMLSIPRAEAAAAFDELTRDGRDKLLPHQRRNWPNVFRVARFIPAVEYINANRARVLGMKAMARLFAELDVIVAPPDWDHLVPANLTGYPGVTMPSGFHRDGTPSSISLLGDLFGEAKMLALARAFQEATDWHTHRPALAALAS